MGLPNIFEFSKLTIDAIPSDPDKQFEVMFNPSTLSIKYENRFSRDETVSNPGNSDTDDQNPGRSPRFLGRDISNIQIKILLDGTGVTDFGLLTGFGFAVDPISTKVQDFLALTMIPDEATHTINTLSLNWGEVIKNFSCNLKSVDINYTLFDRDGSPLRAELDCVFISASADSEDGLGLIALSSPDLTHRKIVKEGDTLPALCQEIYGDPTYYLKIAEVNQLDNFRFLEAGTQLFFPPIDKTA